MKRDRKRNRGERARHLSTPAPQDRIRYVTLEEWQKLRSSCDTYRDQVMLDLLYSTGMRVGELTASRIEDLDLASGFLRIPSLHTKTKTPRTAVLPPAVRAQLRAYLKQEKRRKGPIFRSQKGGALTARQVQRLISQYADRAGIQSAYRQSQDGKPLRRITPHTLRHTHIVHALLKKIPINAVQKQVGHKRLATTQIYSELAPEQVKEAYEQSF